MKLSPTLVKQVAWCNTVGWYEPVTQFSVGTGEGVYGRGTQGPIMHL